MAVSQRGFTCKSELLTLHFVHSPAYGYPLSLANTYVRWAVAVSASFRAKMTHAEAPLSDVRIKDTTSQDKQLCYLYTKTPKFHHITPYLKSLHWLKITQRIQYKILSLTYKSLQYNKPSSISDLLSSHHTTINSFYPLICSCHSPTPFKSL